MDITVRDSRSYDRLAQRRVQIVAGVVVGLVLAAALLAADARLVVLIIAALGTVALTLRYPFVGVTVYLFLMMVRPEELGLASHVLRLELAFALICLVVLTVSRALGHRPAVQWTSMDTVLTLLLGAAAASIVDSVSRGGTLNGMFLLAKVLFAYALVRYTGTSLPRMRAIAAVAAVGALLLGVLALRDLGAGLAYVSDDVMRAAAPTSAAGDPNTLANTLVAATALLLPLAMAPGPWALRLLFAATGVVGLYVTAFTGSRSGVVSLAVVVFLLVALSRHRWSLLAASAITVVIAWQALPQDMKARYAELTHYSEAATYTTRKQAWTIALDMFKRRPLTGCGITSYMVARVEEHDGIWVQPHSLYAQLISETGVLGSAAFLAFIVTAFVFAGRTLRSLPQTGDPDAAWLRALVTGLGIMFIALLVQGLAGHNLLRWNYYVGAALLVNAYLLAQRRPVAR